MLENMKPRKRSWPCKVRTVMAELEKMDAEILEAAVMDSAKWPIKTLSIELQKHGIVLSENPISKHRAKACSCWKN
jgi:hypothetical protein